MNIMRLRRPHLTRKTLLVAGATTHSRSMVIAVAATSALAIAACTGSVSGAGSPAGNVSPVKGLAAVTPAGTKPVSSVVWATTRDVKSLDHVYSYGYPENTADSLMCESLLRQAPDGSLEPGLATVANPSPTTVVFTLRPGRLDGGHPVEHRRGQPAELRVGGAVQAVDHVGGGHRVAVPELHPGPQREHHPGGVRVGHRGQAGFERAVRGLPKQ